MHHEDAVKGDTRGNYEEDEEDDAHGGVACGGGIRLGDGEDVVGAIDFGDAAVELASADGGIEERAVLEVGGVDAERDRVAPDLLLVGAVRYQVVLGRDGHDIAVLPNGEILERTRHRAGRLDELAELRGTLLDNDHGVVIDRGGIVAHLPVFAGKVDLDGFGEAARVEAGAQPVETRAGEIGLGVLGPGDNAARPLDDHDVVDFEELSVLGHLGVACFVSRVVLRHIGDGLRL